MTSENPVFPNRPLYRQGRKETAVKVYTANSESRYLIVRNVPALNCESELTQTFEQFGPIDDYRIMEEVEREQFTDVYWIKFKHVANSRFAKRKLDDFSFLGSTLEVSYAPQYESPEDVFQKIEERRRTVINKTVKSSTIGAAKHPQKPWPTPTYQDSSLGSHNHHQGLQQDAHLQNSNVPAIVPSVNRVAEDVRRLLERTWPEEVNPRSAAMQNSDFPGDVVNSDESQMKKRTKLMSRRRI